MVGRRLQQPFAAEALAERRVRAQMGSDDLERDLAVERQLRRLEVHTHPALAEDAIGPVAAEDVADVEHECVPVSITTVRESLDDS